MEQTIKHLVDFVDASPTPFHAVENITNMLCAGGAISLDEREIWKLEPGAVYFVSRGGSALIAFRLGLKPVSEGGLLLTGAHTDSPALKIRSEKTLASNGYQRVALESYGSLILSGWLDKPLGVAGNVLLRENKEIISRYYLSDKPIAIIPNLAIHLNREINKGFEYNLHQQMPALFGLSRLKKNTSIEAAKPSTTSEFLERVASDLEISPDAIISADLRLFDMQASMIIDDSLINAPRLDDLAGCAAIIEAFMETEAQAATQVACFFDAEEIGSMTPGGAQSAYLRDILARISLAYQNSGQDLYRALARSACVSVDASQALHPGYPEKFDEFYSPILGNGIAIKSNANMNYATDITSMKIAEEVAAKAKIPLQRYMARADIQPGKTIGPITASRTGIPTLDVGHPLLAMHAIRETISVSDHLAMIAFLKAFYAMEAW